MSRVGADALPPPRGLVYLVEVDAFSRILETVRLKSSVLSIAELDPPFGVRTRGVRGGAVFHAVVRGAAVLREAGTGAEVELRAGDVAVLSAGQGHELLDRASSPSVGIETLPKIEGPVPVLRSKWPGASEDAATRIVCGVFRLDHGASSALLSLLPPLLVHQSVAAAPSHAAWVGATVTMLDAELQRAADGASAIAGRLCDVLFVQLLRASPLPHRGFMAALADPSIGRALAMIHEDPKTRWDASVLAERVGMSRSRFFARFTELVGEPPATYLSRWRMSVAADQLRSSDLSILELAEVAGYGSEDAFVRVFKRHFGLSPSAFRKAGRSAAS